jgi:hypothetical protein
MRKLLYATKILPHPEERRDAARLEGRTLLRQPFTSAEA